MFSAGPLRLLCLGLALAIAAPIAAQESRADDPRLVTLTYDETRVFTINGKVRVQTTIKFAPDELIQNVAIGDSAAWQVQPNQAQTILFVKPLQQSARTNMTVVTSERTYLFDLVASPRNQPLYVMQFRYPDIEAAEAEAARIAAEEAAREEANALELAAANDPYAVSDPTRLNFDWVGEGDRNLLPTRAFDNGEAMFLSWPAGTSIPAILITNDDGDEGPVNFTPRGDTLVLDMVPSQIILRSGEERATLTNNNPQPRSAGLSDDERRGS